MPSQPNLLIGEKSPYLLQHAHNPVAWRPWGEQAFQAAREQDKPLFLSIGYSTCHWCHVMERECFEDEDVAAMLNAVTIPVKIDREERPDLDAIYMNACQMMTGAGGWPLSLFTDHDGRPFFAATYIPKQSRPGRMGMMQLLPRIAEVWSRRREEAIQAASRVQQALSSPPDAEQAPGAPGEDVLQNAVVQLARRYDPDHGGFGQAPKFPAAHQLLFLLRRHARTGDAKALDMAANTLTRMRLGGVFDQVGLGFHRYSTDQVWLLPHFEKMLYDQAILAMAYTEGYLATGDPLFRRTALEIMEYVLRDLTGPHGAFLSAEDADSEGEEGRFYVWTLEELHQVLGPEDAAFYARTCGFAPGGNFREEATGEPTGANIPHLAQVPDQATAERLDAIRPVLFAARERRVRPHRDDKVLTDWNGLMIAAMAKAARVFEDDALAAAAARAADFLLARLRGADGRLKHRWREDEAAIAGTLDDHAFLAWGLLELYQATFDPAWLQAADDLVAQMIALFRDETKGGFFLTATDAEKLLVRPKDIYDAAMPSGNAGAMMALGMLARLRGMPELEQQALDVTRAAAMTVHSYPSGFTMMLCALDLILHPGPDVVLAGPDLEALRPYLRALRQAGVRDALVVARTPGLDPGQLVPHAAGICPPETGTGAWVCLDGRCTQPADTPEGMLERLRNG